CENAWPPSGTTSVENLRHTLWKSGSARQAVIFIDACRWDLGQGVAALLSHGNVTVTPVMSTLPSETPFGMTALLPLDSEPMTIGFKGTQVTIQQQGSGPELAERQGRKAFLKATLLSAGNKSLVE